ncbi:hypothetical protein CPC08DRAFT_799668, partial [Agrocybe pediades]
KNSVRTRDRQCRVSGAVVQCRYRGANFTAKEVAHLYPIALANSKYTTDDLDLDPDHKVLLSTKAGADNPTNAIFMRSDVHRFFDAMQFAFYVSLRFNSAIA